MSSSTNNFVLTVHNLVKLTCKVMCCVVDTRYGLGRCLGDCKPVLPEGQKYQFVTTQTVEAISLNKLMADLGFLFLK